MAMIQTDHRIISHQSSDHYAKILNKIRHNEHYCFYTNNAFILQDSMYINARDYYGVIYR